MTLGTSINQVLITKFNLLYAKKNSYVASVKYMIKPIVFAFILGIIVTIIISLFLPTLIDFFLPKYSESGIILGILIFQLLFRLLASPLSILSISLKYRTRLFLTLIKSFVLILLIFVFPKEIIYIAYAMVIAEAIFILLGYLFIGLEYRKELINTKLENNG
jgi:O-antigen/teichoic acid export membrane protein